MKKSLLIAICLLSFACLKAQTYTAGHITAVVTDTMYHDSTWCQSYYFVTYKITIDSSYISNTVDIVDTSSASLLGTPNVDTSGVSPWIFTVQIWNASNADDHPPGYVHFATPVTKIVCGTDTLRYISSYDSLLVTNPCLYGDISGTVYIDNNANCTFDSGDSYLNEIHLNIVENLSSPAGILSFLGATWGGSAYTFPYLQQSWMVNYTVSLPSYYAFIFPYSPCFTVYAPFTTLPHTGIDFPLQCTSLCDLQCNALTPGSIRLHRDLYIQPYVSNTGCDTQSGTFTMILDNRVIYDPLLSLYPPDTVHGDTLIWNYSGLTNLSAIGTAYWNSFLSDIHLFLDTTVVVGDTLCFSGYTGIPAVDVDPLNNSFSFCIPVVYSYDPNEKAVSPRGAGAEGYIPGGHDTLTYTLHFQNTGTAAAINVDIIDTLDSHINAASFRILGTSANMEPQWLAPGVVEFSFNNINLPDSGDNFAASQGAVQFSVALNNGLVPGTQIKNTGYIYFDSNPAVVTNTVLNTIDSEAVTTDVHPLIANTVVAIYPNPTTDELTIKMPPNAYNTFTVTNSIGQQMIEQSITGTQTTVNVSMLSPGLYYITFRGDNGTEVKKFVKM